MDSLGYHHLIWDDAAHVLPSTPGVAALLPGTPGALFCPCDSGGGRSSCCSCLRNGSNASSFLSDAAALGPPAPSAEPRVGEIWGARGSAALVEEKKLDSDETCSAAAIALDRHPKEKVCKRSEQKGEKRTKPKLELLPPPAGVVHVRARRGQATDSHSLAERVRRERLSERMKILQGLVPGCDKIKGKQRILEEIINYVQSLQNQIEFLSMKLASVSPLLHDFGIDLDHLSMNNQPDYQSMITDDKEMMMPQPLPSLYDVSAFLQSPSSIDHRIRNYIEQTMKVEEDSEALLSSGPGQGQCPFSQGAGGSSVMQQFIMLDQKLGFPLNHLTVQQQETFGLANN